MTKMNLSLTRLRADLHVHMPLISEYCFFLKTKLHYSTVDYSPHKPNLKRSNKTCKVMTKKDFLNVCGWSIFTVFISNELKSRAKDERYTPITRGESHDFSSDLTTSVGPCDRL